MNKIISIGLLAAGVILLVYGVNSSHSIGSEFSRFFSGAPLNKSVWLLVGGAVAVIVGLGGLRRETT